MYRFPDGAVIAGGHVLVIASSGTEFFARYGFRPDYELVESDPDIPNLVQYPVWATGVINLGNLLDEVILLNPADQVIDALSWGDSTWAFTPSCPDVPESHSLERRPANLDTNTYLDWIDQIQPAPGQVNLSNFIQLGNRWNGASR